jgi:hypothetical protein
MRFMIATGGSFLAASALLCACTSILGDFKSGPATTSAGDGGSSDSGGDAAPAFKAQVCTEITTSRRELGIINSDANTAVHAWIFTHADSQSPSGVGDVVVAYQETANSQASTLTTWKVKISGSISEPQSPQTEPYAGQVLDVQPVATGFFSLAYESANGSLSAYPSDGSIGSPQLFAYAPNQANRVGGALHVEHDGSMATELATVFAYQDASKKPFVAGAVWTPASPTAPTINNWPVPPPLGGVQLTKLDAIAQGMVRTGAGKYTAIVNPGYGTSDTPAPGMSPAIYTFDSAQVSNPTVLPRLAAPGVLFGGPLASASATGSVNVAMLGGDPAGQVGIFAGPTTLAGLGTLSAGAALKLTPIANVVNDLPINGGRQHWDSFSGNYSSDNFIATGTSPAGAPVFYWIGKDGVAITKNTSTSPLFSERYVSAFDVGFRSAPLGIGSTLSAVLVTQEPNKGTRVVYVEASCLPQ